VCSSPILDGIEKAGVGFYATSFELDVPGSWAVPVDLVFNRMEGGQSLERTDGKYRVQLFVNGFQFKKHGTYTSPFCEIL
jgi:hypothetical protein